MVVLEIQRCCRGAVSPIHFPSDIPVQDFRVLGPCPGKRIARAEAMPTPGVRDPVEVQKIVLRASGSGGQVVLLQCDTNFLERLVLNLAHTLFRHADDPADLFQRLGCGLIVDIRFADGKSFGDHRALDVA